VTGTDRYTDALAHLREAGRPGSVEQELAHAQVNATLALAAATALNVVLPLVGNDHDEVTQWAKLLLPGFPSQSARAYVWPEHWPPRHGDIWQDRHGDRWACQADLTLARLEVKADDTAAEIERVYGPMTLVSRPEPREVECPF
jgi:hypothetical protein